MDEFFFKSKFDWKAYVGKYEDLQKANINTKQKAWKHARRHGHKENRDIFKGDSELLTNYKNFRETEKVKPIPEKYDIKKNISNTNNDKTIFILGNGRSLQDVMYNPEKLDILKQYDTFGMNAAYRKYDELNFYPTYFACCDPKLIKTHLKEFKNLLHNSPIKKFFFLNHIQKDPDHPFKKEDIQHKKYQKIEFKVSKHIENYNFSTFENFYNIPSTGASAVKMAIIMGYKNIVLLGCDCNYTEFIKEAKITDKEIEELTIMKTPEKNENYWFDDYQQKGDIYTIPGGDTNHMKAWKIIKQVSDYHKVTVVNCSQISKIPFFKKVSFNEVIDNLKHKHNKINICFGFKRRDNPSLKFSGINTVCNYIIDNCVDCKYFNYSVSVKEGNDLTSDIYFSTYEKFDDENSNNCRIIFIQDIIYLYNSNVRDDEPIGRNQYLNIHNILKSIKYKDYLLFTTNYQINKLKEELNNYPNINPNNIYLYNLPKSIKF